MMKNTNDEYVTLWLEERREKQALASRLAEADAANKGLSKLCSTHANEVLRLEARLAEAERVLTAAMADVFRYGDTQLRLQPAIREAGRVIASITDSADAPRFTCASCGYQWGENTLWCPECAKRNASTVSAAPDRVRCSRCKAPFENPMRHTGICDAIVDGRTCGGLAERY